LIYTGLPQHIKKKDSLVAASVKKGSKSAQGDRNVAFFFVRQ
jgi:hypothetical protein